MTNIPITLDPNIEKWERQKDESTLQYTRFLAYRDIGPTRSNSKLHKLLSDINDTVSRARIKDICWLMHWKERAEAWDAAQEAAYMADLVQQRKDTIRRHNDISNTLLKEALQALKRIDKEGIGITGIVRMIKLATDIQRATLNLPQLTVAVTGPAGGPVQVEDLSTLTEQERNRRLAEIAAEIARRAGVTASEDDWHDDEDDDDDDGEEQDEEQDDEDQDDDTSDAQLGEENSRE